MPKVSVLTRYTRELLVAMLLIAFVALTSGCGGGSSAAAPLPPSGNNPPVVDPPAPPPPVEGVATPTSVAVVTATNAQ